MGHPFEGSLKRRRSGVDEFHTGGSFKRHPVVAVSDLSGESEREGPPGNALKTDAEEIGQRSFHLRCLRIIERDFEDHAPKVLEGRRFGKFKTQGRECAGTDNGLSPGSARREVDVSLRQVYRIRRRRVRAEFAPSFDRFVVTNRIDTGPRAGERRGNRGFRHFLPSDLVVEVTAVGGGDQAGFLERDRHVGVPPSTTLVGEGRPEAGRFVLKQVREGRVYHGRLGAVNVDAQLPGRIGRPDAPDDSGAFQVGHHLDVAFNANVVSGVAVSAARIVARHLFRSDTLLYQRSHVKVVKRQKRRSRKAGGCGEEANSEQR